MTIKIVKPEDGEVINLGAIRTRILEDGTATGKRLGLVEITLKPGGLGPPQHIHRQHDETFFVLSGTVRFTSGEDHVDLSAGSLLTTPIGVPHTFANADAEVEAAMLCTVTPDLYIDYFRELAEAAKATGTLEPAAIVEIMSRYATEPYRAPST
ncbi:MAG: cupin domain-containing protein [Actinomycetota bacterium]|nr:cupin domain-containing protein [Actinomycetota bacterium]